MQNFRIFNAAAITLVAGISIVSAPAAAQSNACYKGECSGLDVDARGANFDSLIIDGSRASTVVGGTSGGNVDVSYLSATSTGACVGFATVLPDHIVRVEDTQALTFTVTGSRDTTLLIHGPDGWRCNDDTNNFNPEISDHWEAGDYRVWVGSYARDFYNYELAVHTFSEPVTDRPDHRPGHNHGRPDHVRPDRPDRPNGRRPRHLDINATVPEHSEVTLRATDRSAILMGVSGGQLPIEPLVSIEGTSCLGYTGAQPDHIVRLDEPVELEFTATSGVDSTLAIHGPEGWRCNDDYDGIHPGLTGVFGPGTYRVWVGSYAPRQSAEARVTVHNLSASATPQPVPLTFSFQGRFEELDVVFTGETIHGVFQDCRAFAANSDALGFVDDVFVEGQNYRNGPTFWDAEQLCSIAALNAHSSRRTPLVVSGVIGGEVPFAIQAGPHDVREILQVYVPRITSNWVDDLTVNGRASHNSASYWDANELVALISAAIVEPGATFIASGNIEDNPFTFSGRSVNEVREQCVAFIADTMAGEWIDDVTVNGEARHNSSGWWSPSDVCMIVGSLTTHR